MRHRKSNAKLNLKHSHRMSKLKSIAGSLFIHDSVVTTLATAKVVRTFVEPIITKARASCKTNHLTGLRCCMSAIHSYVAVKRLFDIILPKIKDRNGGYLRITKLGRRKGDNAPIAKVDFVDK